MVYDVIIIGAGPSGLAAGYSLLKKGINFIIIEKGKKHTERNRNLAFDVSYGFGGGGLFSDGKFSYPPSASQLWTNLNPVILKKAYNYTQDLFSEVNISLDNWDKQWIENVEFTNEKEYKSIKINEKHRNDLLDLLYSRLKKRILFEKVVSKINTENDKFTVFCEDGESYISNSIIMATGKSGCNELFCEKIFGETKYYCEMGVRVQVENDDFSTGNKKQLDYKLIESIDKDTEVRTFCCCRNGEVRQSLFGNHITYNGETRETETGLSNIGILVRTTDSTSVYANEMKMCFEQNMCKKIYLSEFKENISIIGEKTDEALKKIISRLVSDNADGIVYGPEIEKYGYYPCVDKDLQAINNLYFIGDASGIFRGLMAAFVSGAYVGETIVARKKNIREYMDLFNIKQSDTKEMKLVFTAQSKAFFYCRDVVCQYVLNKGCLPINPFRVFEYFLGDRVDRDLIRRGNNQLIRTCEELWVFGTIADGVLFEIASAIEQGKKIRFFTIGTRIDDIKEINVDEISFEPEVHARKIKKADLISFIRDYGYKDDIDYETQINWLDLINNNSEINNK